MFSKFTLTTNRLVNCLIFYKRYSTVLSAVQEIHRNSKCLSKIKFESVQQFYFQLQNSINQHFKKKTKEILGILQKHDESDKESVYLENLDFMLKKIGYRTLDNEEMNIALYSRTLFGAKFQFDHSKYDSFRIYVKGNQKIEIPKNLYKKYINSFPSGKSSKVLIIYRMKYETNFILKSFEDLKNCDLLAVSPETTLKENFLNRTLFQVSLTVSLVSLSSYIFKQVFWLPSTWNLVIACLSTISTGFFWGFLKSSEIKLLISKNKTLLSKLTEIDQLFLTHLTNQVSQKVFLESLLTYLYILEQYENNCKNNDGFLSINPRMVNKFDDFLLENCSNLFPKSINFNENLCILNKLGLIKMSLSMDSVEPISIEESIEQINKIYIINEQNNQVNFVNNLDFKFSEVI